MSLRRRTTATSKACRGASAAGLPRSRGGRTRRNTQGLPHGHVPHPWRPKAGRNIPGRPQQEARKRGCASSSARCRLLISRRFAELSEKTQQHTPCRAHHIGRRGFSRSAELTSVLNGGSRKLHPADRARGPRPIRHRQQSSARSAPQPASMAAPQPSHSAANARSRIRIRRAERPRRRRDLQPDSPAR